MTEQLEPEDAAIVAAWGRGRTVPQIAEQLHADPAEIQRRVKLLRAAGHQLPARGRWLTDADREHIVRRRMQGATREAIAVELGVSAATIRRHVRALRKAGVPVDPPPELAPRRGPARP